MKVVIVPAVYTPGKARAALAAGRAAAPAPGVPGAVVLPGADLPDEPAGGADADIPCVRLDEFVKPDGLFLFAGLGRALGEVLAGRPAAVALDGSNPVWMLLDGHGGRVWEVPQTVAKVLFWLPDRPVVIHFCEPALLGHTAREWMRLINAEPLETRILLVDTPAERLRFHMGYAAREKAMHHPKARARRMAVVKVQKVINRLKFWRWFDRLKFWRL